MKKIALLLFLTISSFSYAQVGVNTTNPTNDLDVNGTFRVRTVGTDVNLSVSDSILFVSSNGVVKRTSAKNVVKQAAYKGAPVKKVTADYTLTAADSGYIIYVEATSAVTITLPTGLTIGYNVSVYQDGDGTVTFAGSGATVFNRLNRFKTAGKHAGVGVVQYKTNEFVLTGDLKK